jgi:hypothetical protein
MPAPLPAAPRGRSAAGPVAQWLEPAAHNGLVAGSSPAGPTTLMIRRRSRTSVVIRSFSLFYRDILLPKRSPAFAGRSLHPVVLLAYLLVS